MSDTQVFSSAKPNTCGGAGFDRFHENGRASYRIQGKRIQNVSIDLVPKITTAAIFVFFVLTFIINAGIGRVSSRFALTGTELMMLVVACATPTMGYSAQLLPIITAPFYFATPENNWTELIQPHIKPWLTPQSHLDIKYFYEGLPSWEDGMPWAI